MKDVRSATREEDFRQLGSGTVLQRERALRRIEEALTGILKPQRICNAVRVYLRVVSAIKLESIFYADHPDNTCRPVGSPRLSTHSSQSKCLVEVGNLGATAWAPFGHQGSSTGS